MMKATDAKKTGARAFNIGGKILSGSSLHAARKVEAALMPAGAKSSQYYVATKQLTPMVTDLEYSATDATTGISVCGMVRPRVLQCFRFRRIYPLRLGQMTRHVSRTGMEGVVKEVYMAMGAKPHFGTIGWSKHGISICMVAGSMAKAKKNVTRTTVNVRVLQERTCLGQEA